MYVQNYENAVATLTELCRNHEFANWLEKQQAVPECAGLDIYSYLVMPVQRLPRYVLLLTQLSKHSDKTRPDYPQLLKALEKMKEVAEYINEKKRDLDAMSKVSQIDKQIVGKFVDPEKTGKGLTQPQRRFVHMGSVTSMADKRVRHLILFNDIILETKLITKSAITIFQRSVTEQYKFLASAKLSGAQLNDDSTETDFVFRITTQPIVFTYMCANKAQKDEWVSLPTDTISKLKKTEDSVKSKKNSS
eukprot:TRINITY_DN4031_c0_g1_i1.p1 TRINITY_DN4031_c0_g1~~TRINITY_DN4031_c0_g1_i1.p1  ORF type:complete len:248 (-),score=56.30 TRINITY_DN4031_c0_g1_i1:146-889(-)